MLYSSYAYVATLKSIDYNVAMTFILNNNNNNNNVGMMHTGPCFIIKRYESVTEHQLLYCDLPVDYMYGIIIW